MEHFDRRARQAVFLLVLLGSGGLWGCERLTNASQYEVSPRERFEGFCNVCTGQDLGLRHPPCPAGGKAQDKDEIFAYVWRSFDLGLHPAAWAAPDAGAFDLGYDLDCSARLPTGRPGLCRARLLKDGTEGTPWIPLAKGIDNALSQRVLAPLAEMAKSLGQEAALEAEIDDAVAAGGSSVMVAVEHWNGTPNDPKVTARIVSVAGISKENGGPPRWDGHDWWDALSSGPDPESAFNAPETSFKSDDAYVANGTLVLDLRFLGVADLTIINNGARVDVPLRDFVVTADITENEIRNALVVGRWSYSDMKRAVNDVANFLSGCDPVKRSYLMLVLPDLLDTAADLPMDATSSPEQPCDAISVGYGADGYRAQVGGFRSLASLPKGCPP